jgi:hypothetical protein
VIGIICITSEFCMCILWFWGLPICTHSAISDEFGFFLRNSVQMWRIPLNLAV